MRLRIVPFCVPFLFAAVLGCESLQTTDTAVARGEIVPVPLAAHPPRPTDMDVEHYDLELVLDPEERSIVGTCRIRLRPLERTLETVELDLAGLEVRGVQDDAGRYLEFRHRGDDLVITLARPLPVGESVEIAIDYGGRPRKGLYYAGGAGGAPTHVFTQGECEDSRWWFPCWDAPGDRATSELRVTIPAEWTAVAAGERVERVESGATATEHWSISTPHPVYLVTLVAGDFVVRTDDWDGVPLMYLAPPRYEAWMDASFRETPAMLDFFSELTGVRYPYGKYSQACVENFPFGGMENISATTLTCLTLDDELGTRDAQSHGLVAHEAAHQWFGDLVTCNHWDDIWLNEGFATYGALLYFEHARGLDEFRALVRDNLETYLEEDVGAKRRPTVWNVYRAPMDLFDAIAYQGGAARLHHLRYVVGDDAFFEGVRRFVADNAERNVVTADLQRAMERASDRPLGWFFRQWLYGAGYPEVTTKWEWDEVRRELVLRVDQSQAVAAGTPSVFRFPVDVEIRDEAGITVHRLDVQQRNETFRLPASRRPVWVRFDKNGWVPMKHTPERSGEEWLAVASSDDDVNGRREAVRALGELAARAPSERRELYVAELASRLRDDESRFVRRDAARALGAAKGLEARRNLMWAAENDEAAPVRVAALEALRAWGDDRELATFAEQQVEARYSYETMAAAGSLYASAAPGGAYVFLTRLLLEETPHDQLRVALMDDLADVGTHAAHGQLLRYALDATAHPNARRAAALNLADAAERRADVQKALIELLESDDHRLRAAAVEALAKARGPRTRRALAAYYPRTPHPGEQRVIEGSFRPGG